MGSRAPLTSALADIFSLEERQGVKLLTSPRLLADEGVLVAFSLRHGGASPSPFFSLNLSFFTGDVADNVRDNRRLLLSALDLPPVSLTIGRQVHGTGIALVGEGGGGTGAVRPEDEIPETDALITGEPGMALAVLTADCLPVVLVCRGGGPVAAVHAGRRGLEADIVLKAVRRMGELGARSEDILAVIGPGIRACCYRVGEEAAAPFLGLPEAVISGEDSWPRLDLTAVARDQLGRTGVPESQIADLGICTTCRVGDFFSYRRENGITGRQAAVVARPGLPFIAGASEGDVGGSYK